MNISDVMTPTRDRLKGDSSKNAARITRDWHRRCGVENGRLVGLHRREIVSAPWRRWKKWTVRQ